MHSKLALMRYNLTIALHGNTFALRAFVALSSLIWATLMTWTLVTVDNLRLVSPAQDFLVQVCPAIVWVAAFAIQGSIGTYSLLLGTRHVIVDILETVVGAVVWNASIVVLIIGYLYDGRNVPPVWAGHITVALISLWLLLSTKKS